MHSQDNARKPIGRTVVYGEIESILAYEASCDAIQLDILLRVLWRSHEGKCRDPVQTRWFLYSDNKDG